MLRIPIEAWRDVLARYQPCGTVQQRLDAFARAFAEVCPRVSLPPHDGARCPACAGRCAPAMATGSSLLYGRCGACGHGALLSAPANSSVYAPRDYYRHKDARGAGYDDYAAEREYREAKGRALIDRLIAAHGAAPSSLLEVGSGFGFTRSAARARGLATHGVDINPHAAESARRIYGFDTFTGTLEQALGAGAAGVHDIVLYQFVLEHVETPVAELRQVARVLAPQGLACFVVPSMEARELDVFGGAYRSLRSDHLHLFTARSVGAMLDAAGLSLRSVQSTCNLHLLSPALSSSELEALYASGAGPDLVVLAARSSS
jgi:2-polyprenyl-3-methyl-5-hydroxy-6-metoxy-1,4-benzoquinol methylase